VPLSDLQDLLHELRRHLRRSVEIRRPLERARRRDPQTEPRGPPPVAVQLIRLARQFVGDLPDTVEPALPVHLAPPVRRIRLHIRDGGIDTGHRTGLNRAHHLISLIRAHSDRSKNGKEAGPRIHRSRLVISDALQDISE
jgi:hypothetical protein